jgi:acyl-coenzyme A thioesterase PaaI-like protein
MPVPAAGENLDLRTHRAVDRRLAGEPLALAPGRAQVALTTLPEMAADDSGLVHGGFVFGLADHAAMLAVNHPHVVLASAEARFARPVAVGERLVAEARIEEETGRKRIVAVTVAREGEEVFSGRFVCLVPERHVLAPRPAAAPGDRPR